MSPTSRGAIERSFGWVNRFRRLARDYERLPQTLAGLPFVVFSILILGNAATILQSS
jgi:transposase